MAKPTFSLLRQLTGSDHLGLGEAARSGRSASLAPRTRDADRVAKSICPYCAVGCGQRVYVKDEKVIQIEGDPDSPDLARAAVPQGLGVAPAACTRPSRETKVKYRPPARHRVGGARARAARWT